jgi:hypothetical protein
VFIVAGPLDALYDRTYAGGAFAEDSRSHVFPAQAKSLSLPELDLNVVGISWSGSAPPGDFLASLAAQRTHRHLVGICSIQWPETDETLRAMRRQVAASSATYLALGGSPVRRNLSAEGVAAWCPGAPELIGTDDGEGSPLLVRLDGEARVTPEPVAKRRLGRFALQPDAYPTAEDLAGAIRALGDPNLAADVRLTGRSRINQWIDVADLRDRLARDFLTLNIADESGPSAEDLEAATYPELSVAGKLVRVARAEMERAASDDARRKVGAALRLGLALLEGWRPQ